MSVRQQIAETFVRNVYSGFETSTLVEMLDVGKEYPPGPEVDALNEALKNEVERRREIERLGT